MAGHSKWAQIKRQKGVADVKRGQLFSKIARTIILAARTGDPNPEINAKLKVAIEKAKSVNMPKDNIERAIAKASNKDEGTLEEFLYEAYGPEGSAFIIDGITDSKNRSTQEIRHILSEHNGKFASPGTVLWLFDKKGVLEIPLSRNSLSADALELLAIDAGAESLEREEDALFIVTAPQDLQSAEQKIRAGGGVIDTSSSPYVAKASIEVSETAKQTIQTLIEKLEAYDDIQNVYTNIAPSDM